MSEFKGVAAASAPKRAAVAALACKLKAAAAPRVFKRAVAVALACRAAAERGWKAASRALVLAAGLAFKAVAAQMFARQPPTPMSERLRSMPALVPA